MAPLSDLARNHIGNELLRGLDPPEFTIPLALVLLATDPGTIGDLSGEPVGNNWARPLITFTAPSTPGVFDIAAAIETAEATPAGWGSFAYFAIVDSLGVFVLGGPLSAPISVPAGFTVKIQLGGGRVTFQ